MENKTHHGKHIYSLALKEIDSNKSFKKITFMILLTRKCTHVFLGFRYRNGKLRWYMKKILATFVFACLLMCAKAYPFFGLNVTETRLELRYAGFYHSDSLFRHIYGNVSSDYQIEADLAFCGPYAVWANFDWFTKHGRSVGLRSPTRVNIANGSIGVKYVFQTCSCFRPYLGLGLSVGGIWLDNKTCCGHDRASKAIVGGVAKAGVYYNLTQHIYVNVFVDYLYQPVHFEKDVDLGGVKPGVGIGVVY